ncbi:MAG: ABC transporter ATP-binding protein [Leptospiraceae bacterium]|nr:ABC transporter ATP-binding protein [Leptospiraceae bacterium]
MPNDRNIMEASNHPPELRIENLSVNYGRFQALRNIQLTVHPGAFIALIGPNGGGKTTLFKAILGQVQPVAGNIYLDNRLMQGPTDSIGYVPQHRDFDQKFPITVREVVRMGRLKRTRLLRRYNRTDNEATERALSRVGLLELKDRSIGALSGGQLQRVLIARALATGASILLLDEATTHLDPESAHGLYTLLRKLNRSTSIVMSSHDINAMHHYADSIACINRGLHIHRSDEVSLEHLHASITGSGQMTGAA